MSDFRNDCGKDFNQAEVRDLKANITVFLRHLVAGRNVCERCLATSLLVWKEALDEFVAAQSSSVQEAVNKRVDAIDAESARIAAELIRGAR